MFMMLLLSFCKYQMMYLCVLFYSQDLVLFRKITLQFSL